MNDTRANSDELTSQRKGMRWRLIFAFILGLLGSILFFVHLMLIPVMVWQLNSSAKLYGWKYVLKWMREEHRLDEIVELPLGLIGSIGFLLWAYGLWKRRRSLTWGGFLLYVVCALLISLANHLL